MLRLFHFAGACLLFASCTKPAPEKTINRDLHDLPPLVATLEKRDRLVLYEGLPHKTTANRKEFAEEFAAGRILVIRGEHFYDAALPIKEGDAPSLTKILTDPQSFRENNGKALKKCGGFHPDFCVEWQVGDDVYQALICFGCGEAKFYGPQTDLLCDMASETYPALMALLDPYHVRLPKVGY